MTPQFRESPSMRLELDGGGGGGLTSEMPKPARQARGKRFETTVERGRHSRGLVATTCTVHYGRASGTIRLLRYHRVDPKQLGGLGPRRGDPARRPDAGFRTGTSRAGARSNKGQFKSPIVANPSAPNDTSTVLMYITYQNGTLVFATGYTGYSNGRSQLGHMAPNAYGE